MQLYTDGVYVLLCLPVPQCCMFIHMLIYQQLLEDFKPNVEVLRGYCTLELVGKITNNGSDYSVKCITSNYIILKIE